MHNINVSSTTTTYIMSNELLFFFFNDTATTEIYTLSLHDALPIYPQCRLARDERCGFSRHRRALSNRRRRSGRMGDRKSTRLNSSHANISYAVFCLKKKKKISPQCSHSKSSNREIMRPTPTCGYTL